MNRNRAQTGTEEEIQNLLCLNQSLMTNIKSSMTVLHIPHRYICCCFEG